MTFIESFPDLSSAEFIYSPDFNVLSEYMYIANLDIWIPEDICFIPV